VLIGACNCPDGLETCLRLACRLSSPSALVRVTDEMPQEGPHRRKDLQNVHVSVRPPAQKRSQRIPI
jgi:hypothetical protein